MTDSNQSGIWRNTEISAKEISSRRVTSNQFRAFLVDLQRLVPEFAAFTVWRFGHHDRLIYLVDRVPEAIDHYEVRRIIGSGYITKGMTGSPFIEIDLRDSNEHSFLSKAFRFHGPKPWVDEAEQLVRDHISRWPKTWHHLFHHSLWNLVITLILSLALFARILLFSVDPWPDFAVARYIAQQI
jgi:hypothetical protein